MSFTVWGQTHALEETQDLTPGTRGGPAPENIIYEDDRALVFLDAYPRTYGYTLVAPKEHREQVTADFTMEEYLELQRLVYRVSEAVREEVSAERMYIYTFGSNQGNSHTHWHVVPLSPGVPYDEQQGAWASWSKGVLIPFRFVSGIMKAWQRYSTHR